MLRSKVAAPNNNEPVTPDNNAAAAPNNNASATQNNIAVDQIIMQKQMQRRRR